MGINLAVRPSETIFMSFARTLSRSEDLLFRRRSRWVLAKTEIMRGR
jgi:hypothetical protein